MTTATENLENDHISILRLCDVMLAMVKKKSVEINHFELVMNLIRNFADKLHHTKEEDLLFQLLGEKGNSPEQGSIALVLHEHELGRNYVKGAIKGIQELKNGNADALQAFYDNLSGYAYLLKIHIDMENKILFRIADRLLSNEEQQNLLVQFAVVESNADFEFNAKNSAQKIDDLAAIYL